jgi:hypothetical protein
MASVQHLDAGSLITVDVMLAHEGIRWIHRHQRLRTAAPQSSYFKVL